MDACEAVERLQRRREGNSTKQSSSLTDKNNERVTRPSRTTYTSPTPCVSRRCISPNVARTAKTSSAQTATKRAFSAERKRSSPQHRRTKLPDLIWPSTMHSHTVSFQPNPPPSLSVTNKEKLAGDGPSNVAQKSPSGGKNHPNQSENCRADSIGTSSGLVLFPTTGISSLRRLSADGIPRSLHVNKSEYGGYALIDEITKNRLNMKAVDDTVLKFCMLHKQNLNKTSKKPSATSKDTSPRPSQKTISSVSVLGYLCDLKKGKKSVSQLEDAHRLRLLYNRYIQWRFCNAQADAALRVQRRLAEEALYKVWKATLELSDSVIVKKTAVQQLQLELKLNVLLNDQLTCLEDWDLLERDHSIALAGAIKDLELTTLRLQLTGGATADIVSLNAAIGSAVAVMQGMTSSISSLLSKVEAMGCLVSELAELAALEMAMLDDCQTILASTASMQEEEYSLRAQLTQHLQTYK